MSKTNVMRILESADIAFSEMEYEADDESFSAVNTAAQIGVSPDSLFKTLVLRGDKTGLFVCCIPAPEEIDLKKAAKVSGNKSCEMLHVKELLANVGYVRGACSPIGMKKDFPCYFDRTAELFEKICISGGKKGVMLELSPEKLIKFRNAETADLTK